MSRKKLTSIAEIIVKPIMIAIVDIIGPIAFSTIEEKRNASDATTLILSSANRNAQAKRQSISPGRKTIIWLFNTIRGPVPKIAQPKPMLSTASQKIKTDT